LERLGGDGGRYVLRRLWQTIPVLFGVSLLAFAVMHVVPGDPVLLAAILSFLGLGVQPPTPEWGKMVSDGRAYWRDGPHGSLFPGIAIFLAVMGFNCLGDGRRDALDPRMRARVSE